MRGLNVLPVIRPDKLEILQRIDKKYDPKSKIPYILRPFFYSRLHICDESCNVTMRAGKPDCPGSHPDLDIESLFYQANLGLMLGSTSKNLVCIDCDDEPGFERVQQEFNHRGLPFWGFHSSRGGNLLVRVEREIQNYPKTSIPKVEVWGRKHFCVLPPSVHQSGDEYEWMEGSNPLFDIPPFTMPPIIGLSDLEWLGIENQDLMSGNFNLYNLPDYTSVLSQKSRDILISHPHEGERNKILTSVTYDIAAAVDQGLIRYSDGEELLLQAAENCIPPYPPHKIKPMLESALSKENLTLAKDYYSSSRTSDYLLGDIYHQAMNMATSYDWRTHGRTASTDRSVYLAFCERARMDHSIPFRASFRELMKLANIYSKTTLSKSIGRLKALNIIEWVNIDLNGTYLYKFGSFINSRTCTIINSSEDNGTGTGKNQLKTRSPISVAEQDLEKMLGKVSWRIWKHLIDTPEHTRADIARNCRVSPSGVYRNIPKLIDLGAVTISGAEGLFIGEELSQEEIEQLIIRFDVKGKAEKRNRALQIESQLRVNRSVIKAWMRIQNLIASNLVTKK